MERAKKLRKLNDFKQQYREEASRIDSIVNKNSFSEGTRLLSATEKYLLNEISRLEKELYE